LTSALDGIEWSASRFDRFTPKESARGTHWTGGWVGPRAVLDAVVKKIPNLRELHPNARYIESFPKISIIIKISITLEVQTPQWDLFQIILIADT
jgi:hypothetical protein